MNLWEKNPGDVLLSHQVSLAVPSALKSLTSEFGMGSGGTSSLSPPEIWRPSQRDANAPYLLRPNLVLQCLRIDTTCSAEC